MDPRDLSEVVAGIERSQQGLDAALAARERDPHTPSRLPGWTLGHVLTHLARNADSFVRVIEAAARGEVVERYVGGAAGRDAGIEAGADRSWAELVDDVVATSRAATVAFTRAADEDLWDCRAIDGEVERPLGQFPMRRWREVEVHWVDLGIGHEPADWPSGYVRRDLRLTEMQERSRLPMGIAPPAADPARAPAERLARRLGR